MFVLRCSRTETNVRSRTVVLTEEAHRVASQIVERRSAVRREKRRNRSGNLRVITGGKTHSVQEKDRGRATVEYSVQSMVAAATVFILIATTCFALLAIATDLGERWNTVASFRQDIGGSKRVTVRSGETLWEIARTYAPGSADVRDIVDWIRENNRLSSVVLQPGQSLIVPDSP